MTTQIQQAPPLPSSADVAPGKEAHQPGVPESEVHHIEGQHGHAVAGNKILLAVDTRPEADLAWDWVNQNATEKDHVFVTSVIPHTLYDPAIDWLGYGVVTSTAIDDGVHLLRKLRQRRVADLKRRSQALVDRGVQTTVHVVHGDAKHTIIQAANYHNVDLVVVGRANRSAFSRFLDGGSVSSYVVDNSVRTVLVAKGEPKKAQNAHATATHAAAPTAATA